MKNFKIKSIYTYSCIVLGLIVLILATLCSCNNSLSYEATNPDASESTSEASTEVNDKNYIKPITLEQFKNVCEKHNLSDKLEPLMSKNNKLVGYSIKNNSSSQPSNLIFYDVQTEENIKIIYPTCLKGVTEAINKNNVSANIRENKIGNYEYKKATDFKTKDKFNMKLDFKIVYAVRVDCTCLYLECCSAEEETYKSIVKDIGYLID